MSKREPNYKYYSDSVRKVIAVSTFAGKPVRGVAVCAEDDEFDLEFGKKLAKARCDVVVAKKRLNRAMISLMRLLKIDAWQMLAIEICWSISGTPKKPNLSM